MIAHYYPLIQLYLNKEKEFYFDRTQCNYLQLIVCILENITMHSNNLTANITLVFPPYSL